MIESRLQDLETGFAVVRKVQVPTPRGLIATLGGKALACDSCGGKEASHGLVYATIASLAGNIRARDFSHDYHRSPTGL